MGVPKLLVPKLLFKEHFSGTYTYQYRHTKDFVGGMWQLYWGTSFKVSVKCNCVSLSGLGFGGGRFESLPFPQLGNAHFIAGLTLAPQVNDKYCWNLPIGEISELLGDFHITFNGGLRWKAEFTPFGTGVKAFVEPGVSGTYSYNLKTFESDWSGSAYIRAVAEFKVNNETKRRHQFKFSIGQDAFIGD